MELRDEPMSGQLDRCLEQVRDLPAGDYAECGVYRGYSAEIIAKRMAKQSALFLFDSFEGHAEPGPFDNPERHPRGRYNDTSMEYVQQLVPGAAILRGFFPSQFKKVAERRFRFVNVDCDHYFPTKECIRFFLPRMVRGGVMRFDDYTSGDCPGATKAVNEFGIFESWIEIGN